MRLSSTRSSLALGAAGLLALAACGSSGESSGGASTTNVSTTATASQVSSIAAAVPSGVKSKGTLTVAADASYAPNEFIDKDGVTVIGMDVDLGKALGTVMGLNVTFANANFDSIIPGLASGKYDLGMSSFTDTKEREKTVDFVTYYTAGTGFFVNANGGPTINTLDDLCGHHVAVEKGTTQADDATAQNTKCTGAGKSAVDVQVYTDQNGANTALQSGRADVSMADEPVADYQVKVSNGAFKLTGQAYGRAPYGIAIPKGNGMAQPLLDAVKNLQSNGVYNEILTKWGIQSGANTSPTINGAQS
jgi:polar amino acid transport system substrate-binding protein